MKIHLKKIVLGGLISLTLGSVMAMPSQWGGREKKDKAKELYEKGTAQANAGNFAEAEKTFAAGVKNSPKDPDMLNMLAFSQRKQGKLTEAFQNYDKALKLKPDFPEAREYLGEAYIQAALDQIAIMDSYGDKGKTDRQELIDALKAAAAKY